jgi:regulatory protein
MRRARPEAARAQQEGSARSAGPRGTARDRALGLLAVRWRSEAELRQRLRAAGFSSEDIEEALGGLDRAGLVDDARFAREMVREQSTRRRASNRAMQTALRQKGVPSATIEEALAEAGSDVDRALAFAESRAYRLRALTPEAAYRRLYGLLVRRGYGSSIARDACRAALAGVLDQDDDLEPRLTEP